MGPLVGLPTMQGLQDTSGGWKPHPSTPAPCPRRSPKLHARSVPAALGSDHCLTQREKKGMRRRGSQQQRNPTARGPCERVQPRQPGPRAGSRPARSPQHPPAQGLETRGQLSLLKILLSAVVLSCQQQFSSYRENAATCLPPEQR